MVAVAANKGQQRLARVASRVSRRRILKYQFRIRRQGVAPRLLGHSKTSCQAVQPAIQNQRLPACSGEAFGQVTAGYLQLLSARSGLDKGTPKAKPGAGFAPTHLLKSRELANIRYGLGQQS